MTPTHATQFHILLVEDNEDDVLLTKHAFGKIPWDIEIHVASEGMAGLAMLRREPPHENVPRPDLILLDLNMPRMDGRQMLAEMKADPDLKSIPTVVLTTSDAEVDVATAYASHANAYVTKPVDFRRFAQDIERLSQFWFDLVTLPQPAREARRERGVLQSAAR